MKHRGSSPTDTTNKERQRDASTRLSVRLSDRLLDGV